MPIRHDHALLRAQRVHLLLGPVWQPVVESKQLAEHVVSQVRSVVVLQAP